MSGDQLDLDAIEARLATARRNPPIARVQRSVYIDDVAALVAEVRRLRSRLALYDPNAPIPDACHHGTPVDLFCGECLSEA